MLDKLLSLSPCVSGCVWKGVCVHMFSLPVFCPGVKLKDVFRDQRRPHGVRNTDRGGQLPEVFLGMCFGGDPEADPGHTGGVSCFPSSITSWLNDSLLLVQPNKITRQCKHTFDSKRGGEIKDCREKSKEEINVYAQLCASVAYQLYLHCLLASSHG